MWGALLIWGMAPCVCEAAEVDPWLGSDKALHFSVSAGLAMAGYGVGVLVSKWRPMRFLLGFGVPLLAGTAKELADLAGLGHPSWKDMFWNVVGTGSGVLIAWGVELLITPRPRKKPAVVGWKQGRLLVVIEGL